VTVAHGFTRLSAALHAAPSRALVIRTHAGYCVSRRVVALSPHALAGILLACVPSAFWCRLTAVAAAPTPVGLFVTMGPRASKRWCGAPLPYSTSFQLSN
jgi:hypothetical protein